MKGYEVIRELKDDSSNIDDVYMNHRNIMIKNPNDLQSLLKVMEDDEKRRELKIKYIVEYLIKKFCRTPDQTRALYLCGTLATVNGLVIKSNGSYKSLFDGSNEICAMSFNFGDRARSPVRARSPGKSRSPRNSSAGHTPAKNRARSPVRARSPIGLFSSKPSIISPRRIASPSGRTSKAEKERNTRMLSPCRFKKLHNKMKIKK